MNTDRIDLALVLAELEIPLKLDLFDQRLAVQKKVYLAQLMGVDLGYRFGWYLRGPYSPALTDAAFTLVDEVKTGDLDYQGFELNPDVVERLRMAKELCAVPRDFSGTPEDWIELLASLHYLRHIAYRPHGAPRDFDGTFSALVESKPRFADRRPDAEAAWRGLDQAGLVARKSLG